jgi:hypothetical protein
MIKEVPRDRLRVVTYTIQEVYLHDNGTITLNHTYHIPFEPTLEVHTLFFFSFELILFVKFHISVNEFQFRIS